jgi:nicotinamidase-related amidase
VKIHLLCIDPQNDFCLDSKNRFGIPAGALYVKGADEDMNRLAAFVQKAKKKIDDIHVTLDSHLPLHIAHPQMWIDNNSKHPNPFTLITNADVVSGKWRTVRPLMTKDVSGKRISWADYYTKKLEDNKRYILCIWPPHCLIGSCGAAIHPEFFNALTDWQLSRVALVNYVTKGSNFRTEHYSAVMADVEDTSDPTTQLNMPLIGMLQDPEIVDILITGEALSHCVANTITDIANNFGEENIKKFVLLKDTSSSVGGFEKQGDAFVDAMVKRGMRVTTTKDYLA